MATVGRLMVYNTIASALGFMSDLNARARIVVDLMTVSGAVYSVENSVGAAPSVV